MKNSFATKYFIPLPANSLRLGTKQYHLPLLRRSEKSQATDELEKGIYTDD